MPAEGGPEVLVINAAPAYAPVESPDGRFIYVTGTGTDASNSGLWRITAKGEEPKQVLDSIVGYNAYALEDRGIYFIPRPDPTKCYSIRFYELATGKIRTVAELGKQPCWGLTVSQDRRWALYTQQDQAGSDLMLVENFR